MKKFLLKTWLLLTCLLLGVGTAWAETSSWTHNGTAEDKPESIGDFSVTWSKGSGSTAPTGYAESVRLYAAKNGTGNTITISNEKDYYITKVELTGTVNQGTLSFIWNGTTSNTGNYFAEYDESKKVTSVTATLKNTNTSKTGQFRLTGIKITYATSDGGGSTPTNVAPTITTQPQSKAYNLNATATALTIAATGTPTPTYQWYSNTTNSNENGTKIEGSTKTSYTPSTATAGTFYYYCVATNDEGSATSNVATITVTAPTPASLPFSFDGGKSDIENTQGMSQSGLGEDYNASPKLKFDSQGDNVIINFNEAAKKVTYTIKGNGTSGTYAFDVMESADGVAYTTIHSHSSISDATSYTDNLDTESRFVKFVYTTKASGNIALGKISIVAASVLDDPELAFAQPAYTFFTKDEMHVVATSSAGSTGAITYSLADGDVDAFLIDENTGDIVCETAGTYTVTATIAAATGFTSGTATCTVKIKEPVVGNSIIVAEAGGSYYAMTTTCAGEYFTHKAIKKAGDKYVVNSLDDILFYTNTAEGKTTIQNALDAQYVQATAAKKVSYNENEYKWTNAEGVLTAENASYGTLQYNTSSPRFTTYATKVGQYATIVDLANVVVGEIVALNADCHDEEGIVYGTYSNSSAWVVPSDLYVSEISIVDNALYVESYETGSIVPANTGVMVSALEGGDYAIAYSNEAGSSKLGKNNCLRPSGDDGITADAMAAADDNCTFYRLTMHNRETIGFWWGAAEGAAFSLAANKAYLAVPKTTGARTGLWFGDNEEALEAVEMNAATTIYTLEGVKVNELQKGLNIVNGKKVMVK